jgi:hypothetical protein
MRVEYYRESLPIAIGTAIGNGESADGRRQSAIGKMQSASTRDDLRQLKPQTSPKESFGQTSNLCILV